MKIANRIHNIEESKSIQLASKVSELKRSGKEIIPLHVGEVDFHTPKPILEETQKALIDNHTRYSLVEGLIELRQSIAGYQKKNYDWSLDTDEIFIANGSKHILYLVFQTLLNPGDEVIVPLPYWVSFPESVKLAGGVPVFVPTKDHQLDIDAITAAITDKTKVILFNSPNNPTGAVYSAELLKKLGDLALEKGITLVADEAYEKFVYGDKKHTSLASIERKYFDCTVTVQSFSKSFCMTGFRIGYLMAPKDFVAQVRKLQSHLSGNNCTFSQYGAIAALAMDESISTSMLAELGQRKKVAYKLFSELFECIDPDGAFYLFLSVEKYLGDKFSTCNELALHILEHAGVALLPGSAFGQPGYLRLAFTRPVAEIELAYEKIKDIL
jgi:aspartate aminotransferase